MINLPTTLAEARKLTYGRYAAKYREGFCAKRISDRMGFTTYQCQRKNGYGPAKLYCKQHDPDAVRARDKERSAKYKREQARAAILPDINAVERAIELVGASGLTRMWTADGLKLVLGDLREQLEKVKS